MDDPVDEATATPEEGAVHTAERTFHREDVEAFDEAAGGDLLRHTDPAPGESDDDMVHAMLLGTVPSQIAGDIGVLTSGIAFQFHEPVFVGDTITAEWRTTAVDESDDRYDVTAEVTCTNDIGDTVMTAVVEGVVWKE
jgi:acyl dehydratase